MKFGNSFDS